MAIVSYLGLSLDYYMARTSLCLWAVEGAPCAGSLLAPGLSSLEEQTALAAA